MPTPCLCARRLSAILADRCYPAVKTAPVNRFGRARLDPPAAGRHPTGAEQIELGHMSGGFLPRDGWRASRSLRKAA